MERILYGFVTSFFVFTPTSWALFLLLLLLFSLSKVASGCFFFLRQEAAKVCRLLSSCVIKPTNKTTTVVNGRFPTRAEYFKKDSSTGFPSLACDGEKKDEANRASGISGGEEEKERSRDPSIGSGSLFSPPLSPPRFSLFKFALSQ